MGKYKRIPEMNDCRCITVLEFRESESCIHRTVHYFAGAATHGVAVSVVGRAKRGANANKQNKNYKHLHGFLKVVIKSMLECEIPISLFYGKSVPPIHFYVLKCQLESCLKFKFKTKVTKLCG